MNEEELAWACRRLPTWRGIPQPQSEESCQEWLERICNALGLSIDELTVAIKKELTFAGINLPKMGYRGSYSPYWNDEIISKLFGASRYSLDRVRGRSYPLRSVDACIRFCPWCWREDTRSGLKATLREDWTTEETTMCPIHGLPLYLATVPYSDDGRRALADRVAMSFPDLDAKATRVLAQLSLFEKYAALQERENLGAYYDARRFVLGASQGLFRETTRERESYDNPILRYCLEAADHSLHIFVLLGIDVSANYEEAHGVLGGTDGWVHYMRGWSYLALLILWMIFRKIFDPMLEVFSSWNLYAYEELASKTNERAYKSLGRQLRGIFSIDEDAFWLPDLAGGGRSLS